MPIFWIKKVLFGFEWVNRFIEDRHGVNSLCVCILKFK